MDSGKVELGNDFRRVVFSAKMMGHHGTGTQTAERLPDDIPFIGAGSYGQFGEPERFLTAVQTREFVFHSVTVALNPFRAVDLRLLPYVGDPERAVEFRS